MGLTAEICEEIHSKFLKRDSDDSETDCQLINNGTVFHLKVFLFKKLTKLVCCSKTEKPNRIIIKRNLIFFTTTPRFSAKVCKVQIKSLKKCTNLYLRMSPPCTCPTRSFGTRTTLPSK